MARTLLLEQLLDANLEFAATANPQLQRLVCFHRLIASVLVQFKCLYGILVGIKNQELFCQSNSEVPSPAESRFFDVDRYTLTSRDSASLALTSPFSAEWWA